MAKLTKVSNGKGSNKLRTNDVVGEYEAFPVIGEPFVFTAPPLEGGDVRVVCTSPVKSLMVAGGTATFETESGSVYQLEI